MVHEPDESDVSQAIGMASIGAIRRRRFILSVFASGGSKVLALVVQLLALPLALHALGAERYTALLALQSFLSWTSLCGFGLPYSLPKYIAQAHVAGDHDEERHLVTSSLLFMAIMGAVLFVALGTLGLAVQPGKLVAAAATVSPKELATAYFLAIALNSIQLISSIEAPLRSGYQEIFRSSVCAGVASLAVLVGLFMLPSYSKTIPAFLLVLFAPAVLAFLVDIGLLYRDRPYLRRGAIDFRATAAKSAAPSLNALAFQIQYAMTLYLPTLIVAHLSLPAETAIFGSVLQLTLLSIASMNLFLMPLSSAIANAKGYGDIEWIARNTTKMFRVLLVVGLAALVAAAAAGPYVIRLWLGSAEVASRSTMVGLALCFLLGSLVQLNFIALSAIGALRGIVLGCIALGLAALGLGSLLCALFGVVGMTAGMAAGLAATAIWFGLKLQRELKKLRP